MCPLKIYVEWKVFDESQRRLSLLTSFPDMIDMLQKSLKAKRERESDGVERCS